MSSATQVICTECSRSDRVQNSAHGQRLYELFAAVSKQPPDQRRAFLQQACPDDPDLLQSVRNLLIQDELASQNRFLEPPSIGRTAREFQQAEKRLIGQRLGAYEIRDWIASGGMGSVYRAERVDDYEQEVAIKLIRTGMESADALARFAAERQILAQFNHPNIARLLDGGATEEGRPYLVMEFICGQPIHQYCEDRQLPIRRRVELLHKICLAVDCAHRQGILHRDLKPGNVLITVSGTPKLTDFGLAKYWNEYSSQTLTGQVLGTPSYIAPEQATCRREQLGPCSDVYSLGAVLFELLTGQPPFRGRTPYETALQVINEKPVPPRRLQPKIPKDLESICLKCLEKQPVRRYASAEALADDLKRWLEKKSIVTHRSGMTGRFLNLRSRTPAHTAVWFFVFCSCFVLSAAVTVAWLWWVAETALSESQHQRQTTKAELIHVPQQRPNVKVAGWNPGKDASPISLPGHVHWAGEISFHPNGKRVATSDGRGTIRIWNSVTGALQKTFSAGTTGILTLCYSRDGKRLASSTDSRVSIWDADAGVPLFRLEGHRKSVVDIAFNNKGNKLASASDDESVRVWDVRTRQVLFDLKGHVGGALSVAFSPDESRLATAAQDGTIKIWDLRKRRSPISVITIHEHLASVRRIAYSPDGKRLASAGFDNTVRLWDANSGKLIHKITGHQSSVWDVQFSPDGRMLVSGSALGVLRLWDSETGQQLLKLNGHSTVIHDVCFTPDGCRLATSSWDGTVKIW